MLRKTTQGESSTVDSHWSGGGTLTEEEFEGTTASDTDIGKFNTLCPSFFSTLYAMEFERLNIPLNLASAITPENPTQVILTRMTKRDEAYRVFDGHPTQGAQTHP
jgi:hypothetical protein